MRTRIAGVDTSSTTLSYLLWELSRRVDIAQRLQAELDEAMPDRAVIPDAITLTKLPYLNAFIKEGMYEPPTRTYLIDRGHKVSACTVLRLHC